MAVQFPKRPNQDRGVIGRQPPPVPQNPYAAPTAELDNYYDEGDYHTEPFYSQRGRIGRLRYLAYSLLLNLAAWFVIAILATIVFGIFGFENIMMMVLLGIIAFPLLMYVGFVPTIRRLNDLNRSGWISLISLIPYINALFYLYLIFAPGDEGYNDYGAPAEPPTTGIKILAMVPIVLGIIAAVASIIFSAYVDQAAALL